VVHKACDRVAQKTAVFVVLPYSVSDPDPHSIGLPDPDPGGLKRAKNAAKRQIIGIKTIKINVIGIKMFIVTLRYFHYNLTLFVDFDKIFVLTYIQDPDPQVRFNFQSWIRIRIHLKS
jgi:hypothetical protein